MFDKTSKSKDFDSAQKSLISDILEFLTNKKEERNCIFCKIKFIGKSYKSYHKGFGFMNVVDCYCSKKCERSMNKAIRKCFNGKKLSKREKLAIKDLRYVDI